MINLVNKHRTLSYTKFKSIVLTVNPVGNKAISTENQTHKLNITKCDWKSRDRLQSNICENDYAQID